MHFLHLTSRVNVSVHWFLANRIPRIISTFDFFQKEYNTKNENRLGDFLQSRFNWSAIKNNMVVIEIALLIVQYVQLKPYIGKGVG